MKQRMIGAENAGHSDRNYDRSSHHDMDDRNNGKDYLLVCARHFPPM